MRVFVDSMPDPIRHAIECSTWVQIGWQRIPETGLDAAHLFITRRPDIGPKLAALRKLVEPACLVWINWPERRSGVETDITEDGIRDAIVHSH